MSNLRVTSLRGRDAGSAAALPDGAVVTGVTTSTSFSGNLNATQLSTGTIADARLGTVTSSKLSGALPALDGSALTNLNIPAGFSELDAALFN